MKQKGESFWANVLSVIFSIYEKIPNPSRFFYSNKKMIYPEIK